MRILSILHISDLFMLCRYNLRSSQPVYVFWYYIMIHRAVGIHLQKSLPKLVPKTDAKVDALSELQAPRVCCAYFAYFAYLMYFAYFYFVNVSG